MLQPERIVERRKALGYSQEALADLIESNQKTISEYERGTSEPKAQAILKLATALETTSDYLLGATDNPERYIRDVNDLNGQERELIRLFRSKTPDQRRFVIGALRLL